MPARRSQNPKRAIAPAGTHSPDVLLELKSKAQYAGSPYHKRTPADYVLSPPTAPRPCKTLCDGSGMAIRRTDAQAILREGFARGLVSRAARNGWPQNVWALRGGEIFEAQLQNSEIGEYHGYPLPAEDPFRLKVKERWQAGDDVLD